MKRLRSVALVVATCAVTMVLVLLVTIQVVAAKPGEWRVPLRVGLFGIGPTIDVGTALLLRMATRPPGIALLDGRTIVTRHGAWHFARDGDSLAVDCAPCSLEVAALGHERIGVDRLHVTVAGRADRLAGAIRAGDIVGSYNGRFDATSLKLEIVLDRAPIAAYYRLFGDRIPELRVARIDGTARFALRVSLPDGVWTVQPTIDGFAVAGLGTERLAGPMPTVACGAAATPLRRDPSPDPFGPWLPRAVVAAEDQRFDTHPGYDLVEIAASLSRRGDAAAARGASTIPQQLARVLYVGSERTTSRKLRELLYAVEMERTLGRARILALYLAVAPWGDGVCGADGAARHYFGVEAARLTGAQAVWLAAMLHAPDTEYARWLARGAVDADRARRVVDGLRVGAATRRRLRTGLDALPRPVGARTVAAAAP